MGLYCVLFEPNQDLGDFTTGVFALNDLRSYEFAMSASPTAQPIDGAVFIDLSSESNFLIEPASL
jgi:hypothetical protein